MIPCSFFLVPSLFQGHAQGLCYGVIECLSSFCENMINLQPATVFLQLNSCVKRIYRNFGNEALHLFPQSQMNLCIPVVCLPVWRKLVVVLLTNVSTIIECLWVSASMLSVAHSPHYSPSTVWMRAAGCKQLRCHILTLISFVLSLFSMVRVWVGVGSLCVFFYVGVLSSA